MSFPKFKELASILNINEIDEELISLQKNFFDLKLKQATKQKIKNHLYTHIKKRIAQLHYKKSLLLKEKSRVVW